MTLAAASEKRLQLVPNWNGMTMPETTPIPNETAKICSQYCERRRNTGRRVKKYTPSEHRDVRREPDGERG